MKNESRATRSTSLRVRCTPEQHAAYRAAAEAAGQTLSDWLLEAAERRRGKPTRRELRLLAELEAVGAQLVQLARRVARAAE